MGNATDDEIEATDIDAQISDLKAVDRDVIHMTDLFQTKLGYDVYPKIEANEPCIKWKQNDIKHFLESSATFLSENIRSGAMYDSLICIISCHGIPDYLLTSDYKMYSKLAVQRTLSFFAVLREIPRFILFDCCQGGDKRSILSKEQNAEKKEEEKEKRVDVEDIMGGDAEHKFWVDDDENPDHLLARVNAANKGFTSQLNPTNGSLVIYKMYSKYVDAIDGKRKPFPFVHEVFDEIQTELQAEGKQLPESVWNDNTRNIIFKKRSAAMMDLSPHSNEQMPETLRAISTGNYIKEKDEFQLADTMMSSEKEVKEGNDGQNETQIVYDNELEMQTIIPPQDNEDSFAVSEIENSTAL